MDISVVIPVYNTAEMIGNAVESVFCQEGLDDVRLEVLVVDDASTDDTCERTAALMAKYSGVRLIRHAENRGPAAARNRGVAEARGEWVAFLDGDDAWLPHRLATQLKAAGEEPGVALWCGLVMPFESAPSDARGSGKGAFRSLSLEELAVQNPVVTSSVLVRREAVLSAGGFDERFRGPEDYDLWMRVAARFPVAKLDLALAVYRERAGSLSMDDRTFLPEVMRVLDKAFGENGVLHEMRYLRGESVSRQYWHASWMALSRGDRRAALSHILKCRGTPTWGQWLKRCIRCAVG